MIKFEFVSFAEQLPEHGDTIYLYEEGDCLNYIQKAKIFYRWVDDNTDEEFDYDPQQDAEQMNKYDDNWKLMFYVEFPSSNYSDSLGTVKEMAQEYSHYHWMKREVHPLFGY